jgi:hypothetical protein
MVLPGGGGAMNRYLGGNKVSQGMYLNLQSGEFVDLTAKMAVLPGSSLDKFAKVPRWIPFIAGPAVGLFFIIFLPIAGIVALASGAIIKVGKQNILHPVGSRRTALLK